MRNEPTTQPVQSILPLVMPLSFALRVGAEGWDGTKKKKLVLGSCLGGQGKGGSSGMGEEYTGVDGRVRFWGERT